MQLPFLSHKVPQQHLLRVKRTTFHISKSPGLNHQIKVGFQLMVIKLRSRHQAKSFMKKSLTVMLRGIQQSFQTNHVLFLFSFYVKRRLTWIMKIRYMLKSLPSILLEIQRYLMQVMEQPFRLLKLCQILPHHLFRMKNLLPKLRLSSRGVLQSRMLELNCLITQSKCMMIMKKFITQ